MEGELLELLLLPLRKVFFFQNEISGEYILQTWNHKEKRLSHLAS